MKRIFNNLDKILAFGFLGVTALLGLYLFVCVVLIESHFGI